jgi:hypothetical protein
MVYNFDWNVGLLAVGFITSVVLIGVVVHDLIHKIIAENVENTSVRADYSSVQ